MAKVSLQITSSTDKATLTFKTIGTAWEDINVSSLAIVVYGEDKENALHTYVLSANEIEDLEDVTDGLQAASSSIITDYLTADNFYTIAIEGVEVDESVIDSNYVAIGYSIVLEKLFREASILDTWNALYGKNNQIANDVMRSIAHVNGHFLLERLEKFSLAAAYTYDREIGWRKIYKVLDTYYGN